MQKIANFSKNLLTERQRSFIRPVYYSLKNSFQALRSPQITPLPQGVNKRPTLQFRLKFFQAAQIFLQVNRISGSYLEFGSHEANTFRMALNTLGQHGRPNKIGHFFAFDSFSGMPEPEGIDKQRIWRAQMNFTSEEKFKNLTIRDTYRTTTVKGFFHESLKTFTLSPENLPALAYLDCDYYSSTKDVLLWLGKYLRHGCLIAFDDWDCYFADDHRGQRKAFHEFREANKERLVFAEFLRIGSGGMSFICLETDKIGSDFEGY